MQIFIRLNGSLAQSIGAPRIQLTLSQSEPTIEDMLQVLTDLHPQAEPQIKQAIPVISGQHQAKSTPLLANQEVALLMPVAGGSE